MGKAGSRWQGFGAVAVAFEFDTVEDGVAEDVFFEFGAHDFMGFHGIMDANDINSTIRLVKKSYIDPRTDVDIELKLVPTELHENPLVAHEDELPVAGQGVE